MISAVALLWRLRRAGADADAVTEADAERRALYAVAATFLLLAAYIGFDATTALIEAETPESSAVGVVLSIVSLAVMPVLAYWKAAPVAS